MWDNSEDANAYLSGTHVRKDGSLVYISEVCYGDEGEDFQVYYLNPITQTTGVCSIDDLDLSPLPLGFVNSEGNASYIMRKPDRRWKHGLDYGNAHRVIPGHGPVNNFRVQDAPRALDAAIRNIYPSLPAAVDKVSQQGGSWAFSRSFAVSMANGRPTLYYKSDAIGEIKDSTPCIQPQYEYLQELLHEEIRNVGT